MQNILNPKMLDADKKIILTTVIGSMLEYFDFMIFIFVAPIIAKLFFPPKNNILAIIFTYAIVTVSYSFRPVGGIILAHLGDRHGRKVILCFSLLLMALPSFIIGLLPTFNQWGYLATGLLIIMRILQGISLGAEVPASITYISENYKTKNYFFYCSWLTFGANIGIALSSQLISSLRNNTTTEFMEHYGWRIPFLAAGGLALIGFYLRKIALESTEFEKLKQIKGVSSAPLQELWQKFAAQVICGICICLLVSLSTSVFLIFLPNLLGTYNSISVVVSANMTAVGSLVLAVFSVCFAYLTKYINPARIFSFSVSIMIFILILTTILLKNNELVRYGHVGLKFYVITSILFMSVAGINGLFFGLLVDMFPTGVRSSGVAICYNLAYVLGAGFTPLWIMLSMQHNGYFNIFCIATVMILLIFSTFKPNVNFRPYRV